MFNVNTAYNKFIIINYYYKLVIACFPQIYYGAFFFFKYMFLCAAGLPGQDSDKPGTSMVDIQCLLDSVGATELVIDLIVSTKNDRVFEESILLGIALLWGGNTQIQVCTPYTRIYSRYCL